MHLRFFLISMTLLAVVSDYLLHPFYPHFFASRFGVTDPREVGIYFSAICGTVMLAFPLWAMVSKRLPELDILVYTQTIAGILAVSCYFITDYPLFWVVSLLIIVFKGSYLLVYPFILRITPKPQHTGIIGLLSVIIHFGSVLGAILGGVIMEFMPAAGIYLAMAAGDFIQAGMSYYLLKKNPPELLTSPTPATQASVSLIPSGLILKLGIITGILYLADFIIRPFFVRYWEYVAGTHSKILSGAVYAIPAAVALTALWINSRRKAPATPWHGILPALLTGLIGLSLQQAPHPVTVLLGRCIYGWAFFQVAVRFDVLLFHVSDPAFYAIEYSKIHFFQNLGVLTASTAAGILVENYQLNTPFLAAFSGYTLVTILFYLVFRYQTAGKTAVPQMKSS
ncbi:MFS transporter [Chitinophaga nivalis]|uniref:MFS transporter n=1 Tax=Chitinophaga nivalis TaxID=2991709 RepID=A0ABT3IQQ7_9BACT|nr:MFS transporter [Chitinophaga nivalis]MCW3464210.1 MFS transporter [Chitinophaga nivalis]MCW3486100.1 MFS transporter [Chitinophaga nivalis]